MKRRTRARELVLKCLYAYESLGGNSDQVFEQTCGGSSQDVETLEFASNLYRTIVSSLDEIDHHITVHAANWDLERVAIVDKNILRIAICELFYFPDIPAKVSINEAIEMAKKYSTIDSAGFINGILDAIYKLNETRLQEGMNIE